MIERTIARRYAKALLDASIPAQRVRETQEELSSMADLFRASPEFRTVLVSPVIPRPRRKEAAGRALAGRVGPALVSFLQVLVEEGRAGLLPIIAESFDTLADVQEGILRVTIRAARPLSAEQVERLRAVAGRMAGGRRIEIEAETDPALIGGLVARVGDTVVDGSVAGWLKRARERLARAME
jgi:F-type H+-transporting ATPase subunit delta